MKKILEYLEQLGLSALEGKIYLTLLESGPLTVKELADAVKIHRTAAYAHLTSLQENGIIISIMHSGRKQLVAIEPSQLRYLLDKKLSHIKLLQTQFPILVNTLESSITRTSDNLKVDVKYFKGLSGIKAIYADMFKSKEIKVYCNLSEISSLFPNEPNLFDNALKSNPELSIYEIYGDAPGTIKKFSYSAKNNRYFYKFMPASVGLTSPGIVIYDNKVAIVNTDDIGGVVLYNKDFYTNSRKLFDFIWQMLPVPSI